MARAIVLAARIAWATEDKMMPLRHGRQLAELFPDAGRLATMGVPDDGWSHPLADRTSSAG